MAPPARRCPIPASLAGSVRRAWSRLRHPASRPAVSHISPKVAPSAHASRAQRSPSDRWRGTSHQLDRARTRTSRAVASRRAIEAACRHHASSRAAPGRPASIPGSSRASDGGRAGCCPRIPAARGKVGQARGRRIGGVERVRQRPIEARHVGRTTDRRDRAPRRRNSGEGALPKRIEDAARDAAAT